MMQEKSNDNILLTLKSFFLKNDSKNLQIQEKFSFIIYILIYIFIFNQKKISDCCLYFSVILISPQNERQKRKENEKSISKREEKKSYFLLVFLNFVRVKTQKFITIHPQSIWMCVSLAHSNSSIQFHLSNLISYSNSEEHTTIQQQIYLYTYL